MFPHVVEGETVGQTDTADTLLVAVARLQGRHGARVGLTPGNEGTLDNARNGKNPPKNDDFSQIMPIMMDESMERP